MAAMEILQAIFTGIGNVVGVVAGTITSVFTSAIGLIYSNGLTLLGHFILIGLGSGLLIWGFNFIRKLIRIRRG